MQTQPGAIEIKVTSTVPSLPEAHQLEAERKVKEAYAMELLRQGDISSGYAAQLLGLSRLQVLELMGDRDVSVFDDSMTFEELSGEVESVMRSLEADE